MKTKLLSFFLFLGIFNFAQYTYVPDDNFEQELIFWGHDDVLDDYVLTENIQSLTFLNVSGRGIQDLTGIEDFISLEELECVNNLLSEVNLSSNTELIKLYLDNNLFTSLSLPENTKLEVLSCSFNNLQNLNVVNNINLKELNCFNNDLNSIDVSNNVHLNSLSCGMNNLSTLDISNNNELIDLGCHANQLLSLNISHNANLEFVNAHENQISEFDTTQNPILKSLIINYNKLTTLDVSSNSELYELAVVSNNLASLKVGVKIQGLYCFQNQLTSLDLGNSPELSYLDCTGNNLEVLNLKNGHNENILFMMSLGNESLTCIQVDDAQWSENNTSWTVDSWSIFNEDCQYMSANEEDFTTFKVYPNPTKNVLNLSENLKEFNIYDLSGKLILKGKGNQINVSNLPSGTYLIKGMTTSGKTINQKFIKN